VGALASVSVDLDEIHCYTAIHGLEAPSDSASHVIYRKTIERFRRLFDDLSIRATFFVVGRDLEHAHNRQALRALAIDGHEIGNHSFSHFYDLTRRERDVIVDEVSTAAGAIEGATGERPVGFRAPGYTVTDTLLDVLEELAVVYDSSVFPCPAYYAAKALAMGSMSVRGRSSRSILDDPRVLGSPADPYRVGKPYWHRGGSLLELPIGVTSTATGRLPFIGTSIVLGGEKVGRRLARWMAARPLINLELHGIDLADATEDGLSFLAPHQPDLRRSLEKKERALRATMEQLRDDGARFVTLKEAAAALRA